MNKGFRLDYTDNLGLTGEFSGNTRLTVNYGILYTPNLEGVVKRIEETWLQGMQILDQEGIDYFFYSNIDGDFASVDKLRTNVPGKRLGLKLVSRTMEDLESLSINLQLPFEREHIIR